MNTINIFKVCKRSIKNVNWFLNYFIYNLIYFHCIVYVSSNIHCDTLVKMVLHLNA